MGRSSMAQVIHHNSHPHSLYLAPLPSGAACAACSKTTSHRCYSCTPCGFSLHASCADLPYFLRHPSHPQHELILFFFPAYPEGAFDCDACGGRGTAFCYRCRDCSVDLHPLCALLPPSFHHTSHFHPLTLAFHSPYHDDTYTCDVCGKTAAVGKWVYRCSLGCEFDAHPACVAVPSPEHAARFRLAAPPPPTPPVLLPLRPPPMPLAQPTNWCSFNHGHIPPPTAAAAGAQNLVKTLSQSAAQGFVEGVAQQLGQLCVGGVVAASSEDSGHSSDSSPPDSPPLPEPVTGDSSSQASETCFGVEYSVTLQEEAPTVEVKIPLPLPPARRRWSSFQ